MKDYFIKRYFGFDRFLDGQKDVIDRIIAGESAAAIFPTGAGKSLCYQLPAMHLPGMTLVVSPLLSLMKDQLAFLTSKRIPAAKLDSTISREEYQATLRDGVQNKIKILMVSVERFKNERFRNHLRRMKISLLVVDEAHCISEWGHNFRPDYLKIPLYRKEFNIPQVLLLTATATPKVAKDMCGKFRIPRGNVITTGFFRENLHISVASVAENQKNVALMKVLKEEPAGPSIVYVTLQKTAEAVAQYLSSAGFDARPYHAGMKTPLREEIQNHFMNGRLNTVVATIAFGMGIDKGNIRKVIHYDLPKSIENYSQEIGRAGRDGLAAACTLLGNRGNIPVLENFVYGDTPETSGIRYVLETIAKNDGNMFEVRLNRLSMDADIRLLPLKTLLVYLEMDGILKPQYTYFETYQFKMLKTENKILDFFSGERRRFVGTIFRHTKKARVWCHPEISEIVEASGSNRRRVLSALEYFDEKGWIELNAKSSVEVFEILNPGFDVEKASRRLSDLFRNKETMDIGRIQKMISLFESSRCLAMELSGHFGENISKPCGNCSFCRTGEPSIFWVEPLPVVSGNDVAEALRGLRTASETSVSDDLDLAARFFCGILSPRLIQLKAKKRRGFGMLEKYPYQEVKARLQNS
ncbi:ATP-dependent DNA helicase, RecQ family [delta proteobacterium NaphS2]|nr:ATP-dependent DNA helicase, RecQ family [delta proteobacterium NaphS2]